VSIITLTTDFGLKDGNVAAIKGVILGLAPDVRLVDLSHEISPQNIREGAWVIGRTAPFFPEGTIHVVVVDPGVGTARRPIAARLGPQRFVGPDNGLCTPLLERAEQSGGPVEIVHLTDARFWRPQVSHVFHGRDIFAPAAAHLARGERLSQMGETIADPVRLSLPRPVVGGRGLVGEVVYVDHFGNLASNIRDEDLDGWDEVVVRLRGRRIGGLVRTFGERRRGEVVALFGSTGNLIVSVVNGSAARRLGAKTGDRIEVARAKTGSEVRPRRR
jgi:hypothetical protein